MSDYSVAYRCANCGSADVRLGRDYERRMNRYGRVWCRSCLQWIGQAKRLEALRQGSEPSTPGYDAPS